MTQRDYKKPQWNENELFLSPKKCFLKNRKLLWILAFAKTSPLVPHISKTHLNVYDVER